MKKLNPKIFRIFLDLAKNDFFRKLIDSVRHHRCYSWNQFKTSSWLTIYKNNSQYIICLNIVWHCKTFRKKYTGIILSMAMTIYFFSFYDSLKTGIGKLHIFLRTFFLNTQRTSIIKEWENKNTGENFTNTYARLRVNANHPANHRPIKDFLDKILKVQATKTCTAKGISPNQAPEQQTNKTKQTEKGINRQQNRNACKLYIW